jgi:starch phosphorylase
MTDLRFAATRTIAYFSMEVGLDPGLPTYSGGLGILAGDTLRAAADLGVPVVGVTLLYRRGYFRQHLDANGRQTESSVEWDPARMLEPLAARVTVQIEGRRVAIRPWRMMLCGVAGEEVPVYFLDTDLEENDARDRRLTDHLYGGDNRYRLCQEAVLGLGGVAMLRALGHHSIRTYHMNEGHSALLALALLEAENNGPGSGGLDKSLVKSVRSRCVFTTHTPVPAGHDQFDVDLVRSVLGAEHAATLQSAGCLTNGLNMTHLALVFSRFVNGVAMRHGLVSQDMFPAYPIDSITNGVHAVTWTSEPFRVLFDQHIPEWRRDNNYLRYAIGIPLDEIRTAHGGAKRALLAEVKKRTGVTLDRDALTLGFARRAATYKRADLLFRDSDRLRAIAKKCGPLQVVYGGKAHPRDEGGKELIRRVFEHGRALAGAVKIVYLEDYDMSLGKVLCAGVDVWLNSPQKPQEASGTSGMKAALNGVPSLSVLDGWWIEGRVEGVTGWAVGDSWRVASDDAREAASLYDKLEQEIAPLYYGRPEDFDIVRRQCIALNGSFFNAQRMVAQYVQNAYRVRNETGAAPAAPKRR